MPLYRETPPLPDEPLWRWILYVLVGSTVLMSSIAYSFQSYFQYQVDEARKISQ